jgi:hypothetical protein
MRERARTVVWPSGVVLVGDGSFDPPLEGTVIGTCTSSLSAANEDVPVGARP